MGQLTFLVTKTRRERTEVYWNVNSANESIS